MNKKKLFYGSLGFLLPLLFFLFLMPVPKEEDWYCYHVWECNECHKLNRTFYACSGFCGEPNENDLDSKSPCAIHPSEVCEEHVAHGSNLGQTKWVWGGLIGSTFADTSICEEQDRPMEIRS